ncbi:MAG: diacylglycerol kinase family lipid kinase [Candidatus Aminicenantes bacterium]|nr:diacylglycerol kinase family lipid kinase [Acidobacteriota bacterium]MCG2815468.1 diacylglycerol kinase family lipid kinase [Candidatus Aminicenantes bacterium]
MKILLVYNTMAGHKRAGKILPEVEAAFNKKGIEFDLRKTDYPEHAVEIVREADFSLYDGIVAAGGDGTLFEVINGYYMNPSKDKIPLGVLPVGTGNAFARDLELDVSRWEEAVDIFALKKPRKVDVGRFTSHGQDYHFLNIMGLGFVADVTKTAHRLKIFGNVSYTLGVLYQIVLLKTYNITMETDGKTIERENVFIEISNTRWTANFLMAPNAEIDDGYLDVTLLGKVSRRRLLQCFPKIFTGEHILLDEVEQFRARSIKIETSVPKVITPDGELIGITPVEVKCLHQDVPVFWK